MFSVCWVTLIGSPVCGFGRLLDESFSRPLTFSVVLSLRFFARRRRGINPVAFLSFELWPNRFLLSTARPPKRAAEFIEPVRPVAFLSVLVLFLLAGLFAPLFIPIELAWRKDPNYSHGYLIPIICLGLAWRAWNQPGHA